MPRSVRAHADQRMPLYLDAAQSVMARWAAWRLPPPLRSYPHSQRTVTPSDASRRSLRRARVPDMVDALVAAVDLAASLVADRAGNVVGHVQLSRCWIDARERLVEVVTLSPLAVEPSRQRQGVGTALVAAALQTAREGRGPALWAARVLDRKGP
jgi:GNAT superfamily N-acetyltransferase